MELPSVILAILAIAAIAGLVTAYFKRSAGKESNSLLQSNIDAYKDAIKLKDERIAYLEGQVYSKDQTIQKLSGLK